MPALRPQSPNHYLLAEAPEPELLAVDPRLRKVMSQSTLDSNRQCYHQNCLQPACRLFQAYYLDSGYYPPDSSSDPVVDLSASALRSEDPTVPESECQSAGPMALE